MYYAGEICSSIIGVGVLSTLAAFSALAALTAFPECLSLSLSFFPSFFPCFGVEVPDTAGVTAAAGAASFGFLESRMTVIGPCIYDTELVVNGFVIRMGMGLCG